MRRILFPAAVLCGLMISACGDDTGSGGAGGEGGEDTTKSTTTGPTTTGPTTTTTTTTTTDTTNSSTTSSMEMCGDGTVDANEDCDDGNTAADDGCAADCTVEAGWACDGSPSVCTTACGDGLVAGAEACDDGNTANLDGCDTMCAVESGWACDQEPSVCTTDCGDGLIGESAEACDDGNNTSNDGCSDTCQIEAGWSCDMEPSVCMTGCGDGIIAGTEACDDGNMVAGDGCSDACAVESGYLCTGEPSVCALSGSCADPIIVPGSGFVFQAPTGINAYGDDLDFEDASCASDDSAATGKPDIVFSVDLAAGETLHITDGGDADVLLHVITGACASATPCAGSFDGINSAEVSPGLVYKSLTTQTVLVVVDMWDAASATESVDLLFEISACGDGTVITGEGCDDGNTTSGDGCSASCSTEACTGSPQTCVAATCAAPIVVTGPSFNFAGTNINQYADDANFNAGTGCVDTSSSSPNGFDLVFQANLVPGQTLLARELGGLDAVMHVLQAPQCAAGAACTASLDSGETTGVSYTATTAGPVYVVVESYGNPAASTTFDIQIDIATCGDGVVGPGEFCDDGNAAAGDGCSPSCVPEACTGTPATCVAATCAAPIVVTSDSFTFAGTNINQFQNNENYNAGTSCVDVSSTPPSGFDLVFQVDLTAGELLRVREMGGLDSIIHILSGGTCGAGNACAASSDGAESTGLTYTATANGPIYVVVESYGNPAASTTFDIRIDTELCGDGVVTGAEACDDGNNIAGDGCNATCGTEAGFACDVTGGAGSCYSVAACTDIACYLGPCAGGSIVVGSATGLPVTIPDNQSSGGVNFPINIAATGTVRKMAVGFDVTTTWASDMDMYLTGPNGGGERDICTDNGSDTDNFVDTFLRDGVATAITSGMSPFIGVFRPETAFSVFTGQSVTGNWTFRVADDGNGDAVEMTSLDIAFCVNP